MSANESWWKDRLEQGTEVVFLKFPPCCDDDVVDDELLMLKVNVDQLDLLFKELPCLPFLLLGHPSMEPNMYERHGAFPVLKLPDIIADKTLYAEGTNLVDVFSSL